MLSRAARMRWRRLLFFSCGGDGSSGCCMPIRLLDSSPGSSPCASMHGTCSTTPCTMWTIGNYLCEAPNEVCCGPVPNGLCDGNPCAHGCACAPTQTGSPGECLCPDAGSDGGDEAGIDVADAEGDLGTQDVTSEEQDTGAELETGVDGAPDGEPSPDAEAGVGPDDASLDADAGDACAFMSCIPCGVITCVDGCTCANPKTSSCVCP
jgi:hypothetical protein